jgi:hypothetical protein
MTDDGPFTLLLHPRRARWLLLLVASLAFTVAGAAMIRSGETRGWFMVAVFALGALVAGAMLLPGSAYLRLTPDGFEMRSLYRHVRVRWADVSWFRAGRIGLNKMVLFDYAPSYTRSAQARAVASALTGAEAALPDTYGHSAEALVALLNDWRARATRDALP